MNVDVMRNNTFPRPITDDKRNTLYNLIDEIDKEPNCRAKVILLKDEDYSVSEIKMMATNLI
jgi:hypothetical protein